LTCFKIPEISEDWTVLTNLNRFAANELGTFDIVRRPSPTGAAMRVLLVHHTSPLPIVTQRAARTAGGS
jgi:hypothetical protein